MYKMTMFQFVKVFHDFANKQLCDNDHSEKIRLRNGEVVPKQLLDITIQTLKDLMANGTKSDPISVNSLYLKCKDPTTQLLPFTIERLKSYQFLDQESAVPAAIQAIVLAAIEKDPDATWGIRLTDPVKVKPVFRWR